MRRKFSIRDLMAVMVVIAIVLAYILPSVLKAREEARRMSCQGRLAQLSLAVHNYHSAYKHMPQAMGGTVGNARRLSGLVTLAPFMESDALYRQISNPSIDNGVAYPAFGPVPWDKNYSPWQKQQMQLRCPSDVAEPTLFALTNYVFSVGDAFKQLHSLPTKNHARGAFAPGYTMRFRDIQDGMSHTVMLLETATQRSNYTGGQFVVDIPAAKLAKPKDCYLFVQPDSPRRYIDGAQLSDLGRGGNWADGAGGYSLAQTILPPNGPSCALDGTAEVDGVFSASSLHPGGCNVSVCDGAVFFVTDSIDVGDLSWWLDPAINGTDYDRQSPYGIWGAIGSRAGCEGCWSPNPEALEDWIAPYVR